MEKKNIFSKISLTDKKTVVECLFVYLKPADKYHMKFILIKKTKNKIIY